MVLLKCPNKKCRHKWNYKGNRKFSACCPSCGYKINIIKNTISDWPTPKTGFFKRQDE